MMNRKIQRRHFRHQRRGAVLVVALIILMLLSAVVATSTKLTHSLHQRLNREAARHQAEWLMSAGLQRGLAKLSRDSEYSGETWNLSSKDFGTDDADRSAKIDIKVTSQTPETANRSLTISVTYPDTEHPTARITRTFPLLQQQPSESQSP